MSLKSFILHSFALAFFTLSSSLVNAQTSIPIYTIRNSVETNVVSQLAGHPEWGLASLRKNITSRMPSAMAKSMVLPPAESSVLSPQQLYKCRHESALIFGKAGLCGQCPDLHVVFIATATPVTSDGVCFVNFHMVHPIVSGNAEQLRGDSIYFVADRDGQCFPLTKILAYSADDDAAVIHVDTRGNSLNAIPLGVPAETGQHVNLITHPKQMFYTYSQGYVTRNAIYNFPDNPIIDMMEISADFAEGSSGGPVMDDCGNLIGMVRATTSIFHDEEHRNPQMVRKTTVPIKVLKKLIAQSVK